MRLAFQFMFPVSLLLAVACSGKTAGTSNGCPAGSERCACYGNSTCNPGLECRSDLCVSAASGGSAGIGGNASTGGSLGLGGNVSTGGQLGLGGNAGSGGTGLVNATGLPAAQDTPDGFYALSNSQANALKNAATVCQGWQAEPERSGSVVIEYVIDITSSMRIDSSDPSNPSAATKWSVFTQTMPAIFAALPGSYAAGALYFASQVNQCYAANSSDVPIAANSTAQLQKLQTSVAIVQPNGATPTYQAWHHALQTVSSWAPGAGDPPSLAKAGRYIVLITDGVPTVGRTTDCTYFQNGITQAEDDTELGLIQQESTASGVKTFVVGIVGSNNPQNAAFDPLYYLSKLAIIGGTESPPGCVPTTGTVLANDVQPRGHYCHYDLSASANLSTALSGALNGIASGLLSCTYSLPAAPTGLSIDPNKTILAFTDGATGNTSIVLENTGANCDRGWHFTDNTNSKIEICGSTCNAVQSNSMSTLSFVFGCTGSQILN